LPATGHEPVLLSEILSYLRPSEGNTYIDCTLGRAGHASAIAPLLGPAGLLIGLDVDPRNLDFAKQALVGAPCQVRLFHANFAELPDVVNQLSAGQPNEAQSTSRDRKGAVDSRDNPKTAPSR